MFETPGNALQVSVDDQVRLHVRHFPGRGGPAILMVHGLVEDGRIFWSRGGQGLAPWLADAGYEVYVADLRGRGESEPPLSRGLQVTQHQLITEDLPALFELIAQRHPNQPWFAISHSWGGVWLASALARQPQWLQYLAGQVHFASKRVIRQRNWRKRLMIDLLWCRVAPLIGLFNGLIPARALGIGSADESRAMLRANLAWMNGGQWRDLEDGFDYALAVKTLAWPPGLYLAGKNDHYLGHVDDVKAFARELGEHDAQVVLLKKGLGCSRNYGHNDLLTHPQATQEHFPLVLDWLGQRAPGYL
ncbi:alpha/beta fold hydrolase [Halopseudomonas phragmitis]|uniref:alpha/beta fold hydrolase n=1 Tax=Pseudomonadaceae TaxID=135621 RepID=UPI0013EF2BF2|nr:MULTISPECIES: alpha/beta fold hydrolase [Pseudomonadaceae]